MIVHKDEDSLQEREQPPARDNIIKLEKLNINRQSSHSLKAPPNQPGSPVTPKWGIKTLTKKAKFPQIIEKANQLEGGSFSRMGHITILILLTLNILDHCFGNDSCENRTNTSNEILLKNISINSLEEATEWFANFWALNTFKLLRALTLLVIYLYERHKQLGIKTSQCVPNELKEEEDKSSVIAYAQKHSVSEEIMAEEIKLLSQKPAESLNLQSADVINEKDITLFDIDKEINTISINNNISTMPAINMPNKFRRATIVQGQISMPLPSQFPVLERNHSEDYKHQYLYNPSKSGFGLNQNIPPQASSQQQLLQHQQSHQKLPRLPRLTPFQSSSHNSILGAAQAQRNRSTRPNKGARGNSDLITIEVINIDKNRPKALFSQYEANKFGRGDTIGARDQTIMGEIGNSPKNRDYMTSINDHQMQMMVQEIEGLSPKRNHYLQQQMVFGEECKLLLDNDHKKPSMGESGGSQQLDQDQKPISGGAVSQVPSGDRGDNSTGVMQQHHLLAPNSLGQGDNLLYLNSSGGSGAVSRQFHRLSTNGSALGVTGTTGQDRQNFHWFQEFPRDTNLIFINNSSNNAAQGTTAYGAYGPSVGSQQLTTQYGLSSNQLSASHAQIMDYRNTGLRLAPSGVFSGPGGLMPPPSGFGFNPMFKRGMTTNQDEQSKSQKNGGFMMTDQSVRNQSLQKPGSILTMNQTNLQLPSTINRGFLGFKKLGTQVSGNSVAISSQLQVESQGAIYRKQLKKLETQLMNTKIFLNMVIHDMRNPTNSIEYALKEVLKVIQAFSQGDKRKIESSMRGCRDAPQIQTGGAFNNSAFNSKNQTPLIMDDSQNQSQYGGLHSSWKASGKSAQGNYSLLQQPSSEISKKRSLNSILDTSVDPQGLQIANSTPVNSNLTTLPATNNANAVTLIATKTSINNYQHHLLVNPGALPEVKEAYDESSVGNGSMMFASRRIGQVASGINNNLVLNSGNMQLQGPSQTSELNQITSEVLSGVHNGRYSRFRPPANAEERKSGQDVRELNDESSSNSDNLEKINQVQNHSSNRSKSVQSRFKVASSYKSHPRSHLQSREGEDDIDNDDGHHHFSYDEGHVSGNVVREIATRPNRLDLIASEDICAGLLQSTLNNNTAFNTGQPLTPHLPSKLGVGGQSISPKGMASHLQQQNAPHHPKIKYRKLIPHSGLVPEIEDMHKVVDLEDSDQKLYGTHGIPNRKINSSQSSSDEEDEPADLGDEEMEEEVEDDEEENSFYTNLAEGNGTEAGHSIAGEILGKSRISASQKRENVHKVGINGIDISESGYSRKPDYSLPREGSPILEILSVSNQARSKQVSLMNNGAKGKSAIGTHADKTGKVPVTAALSLQNLSQHQGNATEYQESDKVSRLGGAPHERILPLNNSQHKPKKAVITEGSEKARGLSNNSKGTPSAINLSPNEQLRSHEVNPRRQFFGGHPKSVQNKEDFAKNQKSDIKGAIENAKHLAQQEGKKKARTIRQAKPHSQMKHSQVATLNERPFEDRPPRRDLKSQNERSLLLLTRGIAMNAENGSGLPKEGEQNVPLKNLPQKITIQIEDCDNAEQQEDEIFEGTYKRNSRGSAENVSSAKRVPYHQTLLASGCKNLDGGISGSRNSSFHSGRNSSRASHAEPSLAFSRKSIEFNQQEDFQTHSGVEKSNVYMNSSASKKLKNDSYSITSGALKKRQYSGSRDGNMSIIGANANSQQTTVHNIGVVMVSNQDKHQIEQWVKNSLLSSTMLLNLINDLLDLAKIENSQFNFNTTIFNLHEIIQKAIDTLDFLAHQKGIALLYDFDPETALYFMEISGDDNRYLQILLNFLSNSLKFTNSGSVRIQLCLEDTQDILPANGQTQPGEGANKVVQEILAKSKLKRSSSFDKAGMLLGQDTPQKNGSRILTNKRKTSSNMFDANKLGLKDEVKENYISFQIKITDTGVGISKENLPKLFMNFSKLEEHAAGNKTGTGLGLSICKSLLELMGGSVTVESEVGVGTVFIMQLKTKCKYKQNKLSQRWISNFKQRLVNGVTEQQDHDFSLGQDGQYLLAQNTIENSSLNMQSSHQNSAYGNSRNINNRSQSMPKQHKISGITPMYLKANLAKQQTVESQQDEDFESKSSEEEQKRMTLTVPKRKPSKFLRSRRTFKEKVSAQLTEELESVVEEKDIQDTSPNDEKLFKRGPKYKALVANDDNFQLTIISSILEGCNFEVTKALNGLVALEHYFAAQKEGRRFDVVILDLDMPIMNGYEACSRIRLDEEGNLDLMQLVRIESRTLLGKTQKIQRVESGGLYEPYDSLRVADEVIMRDAQEIEKVKSKVLIIALSGLITDNVELRGKQVGFDAMIENPITIEKVQKQIIGAIENLKLLHIQMQQVQDMRAQNIMLPSGDPAELSQTLDNPGAYFGGQGSRQFYSHEHQSLKQGVNYAFQAEDSQPIIHEALEESKSFQYPQIQVENEDPSHIEEKSEHEEMDEGHDILTIGQVQGATAQEPLKSPTPSSPTGPSKMHQQIFKHQQMLRRMVTINEQQSEEMSHAGGTYALSSGGRFSGPLMKKLSVGANSSSNNNMQDHRISLGGYKQGQSLINPEPGSRTVSNE